MFNYTSSTCAVHHHNQTTPSSCPCWWVGMWIFMPMHFEAGLLLSCSCVYAGKQQSMSIDVRPNMNPETNSNSTWPITRICIAQKVSRHKGCISKLALPKKNSVSSCSNLTNFWDNSWRPVILWTLDTPRKNKEERNQKRCHNPSLQQWKYIIPIVTYKKTWLTRRDVESPPARK